MWTSGAPGWVRDCITPALGCTCEMAYLLQQHKQLAACSLHQSLPERLCIVQTFSKWLLEHAEHEACEMVGCLVLATSCWLAG